MPIRDNLAHTNNRGTGVKLFSEKVFSSFPEGTITIEAAYLMPMIIYMIFSIMYLSFFLHDMVRIQATVDKVLYKAAMTGKHDADITNGEYAYEFINEKGLFELLTGDNNSRIREIESYLREELSEGLFLCRVCGIDTEVDAFTVKISVEYTTQIDLPIFGYLFRRFHDMKTQETSAIHNPTETLRAAEVILEVGSSIKGVNELQNKVKSFLEGSVN